MKARWYFSSLIIIFTLLGVANYQQIPVANQEIVMEFTQLKVSSNEAKLIIAIVKKQLQAIGVENIQIVEQQEIGNIKIIYYSDTDVACVKKILFEANELSLDNMFSDENEKSSKYPSSDHSKTYNIDVFEIQKQDVETGFSGKFAIELKTEFNRFFIPNVYLSNSGTNVKDVEAFEKETYKFSKNSGLALDYTSHIIPEVRAGPFC